MLPAPWAVESRTRRARECRAVSRVVRLAILKELEVLEAHPGHLDRVPSVQGSICARLAKEPATPRDNGT